MMYRYSTHIHHNTKVKKRIGQQQPRKCHNHDLYDEEEGPADVLVADALAACLISRSSLSVSNDRTSHRFRNSCRVK